MIRIRALRGPGDGAADRGPAAGDVRPASLEDLEPAPPFSDGEAVAPLGTAGTEYGPAAAGLLADEEAVGSLAPADGGLVGAFHGEFPGRRRTKEAAQARFSEKPSIALDPVDSVNQGGVGPCG